MCVRGLVRVTVDLGVSAPVVEGARLEAAFLAARLIAEQMPSAASPGGSSRASRMSADSVPVAPPSAPVEAVGRQPPDETLVTAVVELVAADTVAAVVEPVPTAAAAADTHRDTRDDGIHAAA